MHNSYIWVVFWVLVHGSVNLIETIFHSVSRVKAYMKSQKASCVVIHWPPNNQIWKEIMPELNDKPSSVTAFSTDFPFQNLVFWNLFEFSAQKSLSLTFLIQILPNKFYQILLIKIFPTTPKAHSNSSEIFSSNLI